MTIKASDTHNCTVLQLDYYRKTATTLLRMLFQFLPISEDLHRPISDLWVNVWQHYPGGVVDTWSACYGILCAKVLARLDDISNDWASMNGRLYLSQVEPCRADFSSG